MIPTKCPKWFINSQLNLLVDAIRLYRAYIFNLFDNS
jgi:hypothetical protein